MITTSTLFLAIVLNGGLKDFDNKQTEWVCTALYMNYFDGCVDAQTGPSYTEDQINQIINGCKSKAKPNVRRFRLCKDVKFDDEP